MKEWGFAVLCLLCVTGTALPVYLCHFLSLPLDAALNPALARDLADRAKYTLAPAVCAQWDTAVLIRCPFLPSPCQLTRL
jgi:hypothetical protein